MKRKVYAKQMKMLKEKSKSQEKEQGKESEVINRSASSESSASGSAKSNTNTKAPKATCERTTRSSSTLAVSPSTSTPWPNLSTSASNNNNNNNNNRPLPTVDVLMKSSTLRAFQLRQPHEQAHCDNDTSVTNATDNSIAKDNQKYAHTSEHNNTSNNNNNNADNNKKDNSPTASSLSSLSPYTDKPDHFENARKVERWVKDCSTVEQTPNPPPKLVHPSSYGIEYPSTYNVNLDHTDLHTNESATAANGMQSPPPVFHQLQASRLNDRIINTETPHDMSGFSNEPEHNSFANHKGPQDNYGGILGNGSDVTYHHQHPHDASGYNYNDSTHHHHHNHNININDDHLHEHHGQVRAWEQENYRYVDYTWRHSDSGDCNESMYSESKSADEENDDNDSSVMDESVDLSNKTSTRTTTRSGGGSGGGRRRRKRVQTPVQRSAANMRERRRMCHLNVAFDYLKEHLPNVKDKKKLSRIQTLKAAIYYIHLLQDSLNVH